MYRFKFLLHFTFSITYLYIYFLLFSITFLQSAFDQNMLKVLYKLLSYYKLLLLLAQLLQSS